MVILRVMNVIQATMGENVESKWNSNQTKLRCEDTISSLCLTIFLQNTRKRGMKWQNILCFESDT